jgi:CheY-like chemotaxis protein
VPGFVLPAMTRRVLVAVEDLFFLTRIQGTAQQVGVAIETCPVAELPARCASAPPDLVVLDLHAPGDPLERARELKRSGASANIPIVAFYSHVEGELRERALAAGIDRVLPRSAFTSRLAEWLAGAS